jgi:hypothetical protein
MIAAERKGAVKTHKTVFQTGKEIALTLKLKKSD